MASAALPLGPRTVTVIFSASPLPAVSVSSAAGVTATLAE